MARETVHLEDCFRGAFAASGAIFASDAAIKRLAQGSEPFRQRVADVIKAVDLFGMYSGWGRRNDIPWVDPEDLE